MFKIFKKMQIFRADTTSNINLVNKTFILRRDYLNPFVSYYIIVLAVEDGWLQYNYVFKDIGAFTGPPQSAKISAFLRIFAEIKKPF